MLVLGLVIFCSKPFFVGAPIAGYTWWDAFYVLFFLFSMNFPCLFIKKKKKIIVGYMFWESDMFLYSQIISNDTIMD